MKRIPEIKITEVVAPEEEIGYRPRLLFLSKSYVTGKLSLDIESVESSCFDRDNLESSTFWDVFTGAINIIIIDKFLLNEDLSKMLKIIELNEKAGKLNDFKKLELFTENCSDKKERLQTIKRKLKEKFQTYELKNKFVHDRFAILDNELFHFGCTVGGKTKEGFTAFSCGWDAKKIDILISELKRNERCAGVIRL